MYQPNPSPSRSTSPRPLSTTHAPVFTEPTFLMCAPKLYDVDYVINPWMSGNVHRTSRPTAEAQWEQLRHSLSQVARVLLVEPQPGWPDMVFTANAGLIRDEVVAVSRFTHPERQGEEPHFRQWFQDLGFTVWDTPPTTPFEGEGDALFEVDGSRLWAGYGLRTTHSSHVHLQKLWEVEVISLHLVDPRFYHLDTCFCPLAGGYLLYFPAAFDPKSLAEIESRYPKDKLIAVSESDALRFACNAINLGRTILSNEISAELSTCLGARGFELIQVQLSEFLKAGGAAKCLVLRLSELKTTHQPPRPPHSA
jgi:N-dimethylarginine dimethylaminohydrolase